MKPINRRKVIGMSLIELMIAILIGSFLIIGLIQVFSASREAYRLSEGLARVQENGRFAMDYLQRDIRMIGHLGCVNDQSRLQAVADTFRSHFTSGGTLDFAASVQGYEGPPPAALNLSPEPLAGSDSIVLRFLSGTGVPVTELDPAARTIEVDATKWDVLTQGGVASPALFGIADCAYADIFPASATATGLVTAPATVDLDRYGASPEGGPAVLYRAEAIVYYIGEGTGGMPSLFRARINAGGSTSEELVEGVENMQLRYGMDRSTDVARPSGYIASEGTATVVDAAPNGWRRVGQVQVGLLLSSPNPASATQAVVAPTLLGAAPAIPDDRHYRSAYQSTIALRNRLYGN